MVDSIMGVTDAANDDPLADICTLLQAASERGVDLNKWLNLGFGVAIMALVDDAAVPHAFVVQQGFVGAPTGHDAWGGFVEESARCRAAPRGVVEID